MAPLCRLKTLTLRFGMAIAVGELKPLSHFSLPNLHLLLVRHLTTTTTSSPSENQQHSNFTVNYLINSCGLSPKGAILASKLAHLQSPERPDAVLGLLRNHGFSETLISKLVRSRPQLLLSDPQNTLLPKLEFFVSLGVSKEEVARAVASNPHLLTASLENRIVPTCNFLRSMLTHKNVVAVFKRGSKIFSEGYFKHVEPNIAILRELGMPPSCISVLLTHSTYSLMPKPKKFGQVVNVVTQMGFNLEKSTSVFAIKALCSKNSRSIWNRSRQVYMERWNWSENDVLSAFTKFPECMVKSEKKIMQVMEFLVEKMGWPSRAIAEYPVVLCYSLDKRIIPRCSVIQVLLLKGFISEIEIVSLSSLLCPVEKYFLKRFVAKYIDQVPHLLSVYQGKVGVKDVCL